MCAAETLAATGEKCNLVSECAAGGGDWLGPATNIAEVGAATTVEGADLVVDAELVWGDRDLRGSVNALVESRLAEVPGVGVKGRETAPVGGNAAVRSPTEPEADVDTDASVGVAIAGGRWKERKAAYNSDSIMQIKNEQLHS